jgi:hypothetical protein
LVGIHGERNAAPKADSWWRASSLRWPLPPQLPLLLRDLWRTRRTKLWFDWRFIPNVYITAGVENVLNSPNFGYGREFFVGGGMRFDELERRSRRGVSLEPLPQPAILRRRKAMPLGQREHKMVRVKSLHRTHWNILEKPL